MPYVTLLEASQIVSRETGIDITVLQLIRAGFVQNLPLCVLLDVKCYSPTHKIRNIKHAQETDPDYWENWTPTTDTDAGTVEAYGLFVLPQRHIFAYQTKETVHIQYVSSLDGLDNYCPFVEVSRDALQITLQHLDAFITHIKTTQAAQQKKAPETDTAKPALEVKLDYSLLATPTELLDAFEKWGLRAAWFAELDSHKWLLEAQRKKGQGQRGNVIPPLFCPFAVMNGLIGKVRKANRLQPDTAWRTLEHKFPKVHATFESHDPRERTGD